MKREGKQDLPPPPAPSTGHTLLTRALGHRAQQALHGLQQSVLLPLQEAGVASGSAQAAREAGEGAVLAAQQAPQPLLLLAEAGQLRLLLCLQGPQPGLQRAAGRGGGAHRGEPAFPRAATLDAFPWSPSDSAGQTRAEAQRGRASSQSCKAQRPVAQSEKWRRERLSPVRESWVQQRERWG